jgi:hypothetical protein
MLDTVRVDDPETVTRCLPGAPTRGAMLIANATDAVETVRRDSMRPAKQVHLTLINTEFVCAGRY